MCDMQMSACLQKSTVLYNIIRQGRRQKRRQELRYVMYVSYYLCNWFVCFLCDTKIHQYLYIMLLFYVMVTDIRTSFESLFKDGGTVKIGFKFKEGQKGEHQFSDTSTVKVCSYAVYL